MLDFRFLRIPGGWYHNGKKNFFTPVNGANYNDRVSVLSSEEFVKRITWCAVPWTRHGQRIMQHNINYELGRHKNERESGRS